MKASLIALLPVLWAAPALAQDSTDAGAPAAPSSKPAPAAPPPAADPHAGHDMGAMPAMAMPQTQVAPATDPHAGHDHGRGGTQLWRALGSCGHSSERNAQATVLRCDSQGIS